MKMPVSRTPGSLVLLALLLCLAIPLIISSEAARAQGMADVVSGLKTDPDAPIEVEADQLDIYDKKKIAVFTGNVRANQGETKLKTASLTIHYSGGGAGTAQSITRLEASGGVIVSQKDQRAEGASAVVNMANETITLSGNVILVQGKNVLRGSKLSINMRSGAARLHSAGQSGGKGRVQGVFMPGKAMKK